MDLAGHRKVDALRIACSSFAELLSHSAITVTQEGDGDGMHVRGRQEGALAKLSSISQSNLTDSSLVDASRVKHAASALRLQLRSRAAKLAARASVTAGEAPPPLPPPPPPLSSPPMPPSLPSDDAPHASTDLSVSLILVELLAEVIESFRKGLMNGLAKEAEERCCTEEEEEEMDGKNVECDVEASGGEHGGELNGNIDDRAPLGHAVPFPPPLHGDVQCGTGSAMPTVVAVNAKPSSGTVTPQHAFPPKESFSDLVASCVQYPFEISASHSWASIVGAESAVRTLRQVTQLPLMMPHLFSSATSSPYRLPPRCILMYGPPGTGKTMLASVCAKECNAMFISVSASDLLSKWVGGSERHIRDLFDFGGIVGAAEHRDCIGVDESESHKRRRFGCDALSPSSLSSPPNPPPPLNIIMFLDEIDALCGARGSSGESEAARRVKTEFLIRMQALLDGSLVGEKAHDGGGRRREVRVVLLAATNMPWELDPAFRRRFQRFVHVGLPSHEARAGLLEKALSTLDPLREIDWGSFERGGSSSGMRRSGAVTLLGSATGEDEEESPHGRRQHEHGKGAGSPNRRHHNAHDRDGWGDGDFAARRFAVSHLLADLTEHYSCAEINTIISTAIAMPLTRMEMANQFRRQRFRRGEVCENCVFLPIPNLPSAEQRQQQGQGLSPFLFCPKHCWRPFMKKHEAADGKQPRGQPADNDNDTTDGDGVAVRIEATGGGNEQGGWGEGAGEIQLTIPHQTASNAARSTCSFTEAAFGSGPFEAAAVGSVAGGDQVSDLRPCAGVVLAEKEAAEATGAIEGQQQQNQPKQAEAFTFYPDKNRTPLFAVASFSSFSALQNDHHKPQTNLSKQRSKAHGVVGGTRLGAVVPHKLPATMLPLGLLLVKPSTALPSGASLSSAVTVRTATRTQRTMSRGGGCLLSSSSSSSSSCVVLNKKRQRSSDGGPGDANVNANVTACVNEGQGSEGVALENTDVRTTAMETPRRTLLLGKKFTTPIATSSNSAQLNPFTQNCSPFFTQKNKNDGSVAEVSVGNATSPFAFAACVEAVDPSSVRQANASFSSFQQGREVCGKRSKSGGEDLRFDQCRPLSSSSSPMDCSNDSDDDPFVLFDGSFEEAPRFAFVTVRQNGEGGAAVVGEAADAEGGPHHQTDGAVDDVLIHIRVPLLVGLPPVTFDDFKAAIASCPRATTKEELERYARWEASGS